MYSFRHYFPLPSCVLPLFLLLAASSLSVSLSLRDIPATNVTVEHLDPTLPPALPLGQAPKCSILVLSHEFAASQQPAATASFAQPEECPAPWTRVVLELSLSVSAPQKDSVAAVWVNGAEVLRTATPFPIAPGAYWRVHKDVTRYTALFRQLDSCGSGAVSMVLEQSAAALPGGVFTANVSLHFYRGGISKRAHSLGYTAHPTVKGLYRDPADLIIPISDDTAGAVGFWFRVNNAAHVPAATVTVPRNTYRAVLEIFPSYHADDEFWYTNPLRSSYDFRPIGGGVAQANGGFRQVFATVDGRFAGGHIPFAVIYPGAINPYFWSPVAAIGAFDMPSYDLDLTPLLGLLLDGQPHEIGLGVKDCQSYWLLSANLHIWIDAWSDATQAGVVDYFAPELKINRHAEWQNQDGQSEVDAEGLVRFTGWVSSSRGNITTAVRQKVKFKSQVEVQNRGAVKQVEVINKERSTVATSRGHQTLGRVQLFVEAPLQVQTSSVRAVGGAVFERTRLSHQLQEVVNLSDRNMAVSSSALTDRQDAEGSALMHAGKPVWGSGSTRASYKYRDENTCYLRTLNTADGVVRADVTSPSCSAVADA